MKTADQTADEKLFYGGKGTPPDRADDSTEHPLAKMATAMGLDEKPLPWLVKNLINQIHETATERLGWDAARERTEIEGAIETIKSAGLAPEDHDYAKHFATGVLSAELGTPIDAAFAQQRLQQFRAEQRAMRGDRGYEELQTRVNRWLATQPRLSQLIERARTQSNPEVLSGLFDFVHDNNLGRAK
jgi:hypothetical protein